MSDKLPTEEPKDWIDRIPMRLKKALVNFREKGQIPGGFLFAVLCNDLKTAIFKADDESKTCLKELLWWLSRFMPHQAWGGRDRVVAWSANKGLEGVKKQSALWDNWDDMREAELKSLGRESEL